MLQAGQSPVPGYKLEKFLGRGNFGEVWQSTSPGGTKSALKFLNLAQKQGRKEFRAIQRLKQIRHANLMPINAMWLLDQEGKVIPDEYLDTDASLMPETLHQTMSVSLLPPGINPAMLVIAMPQAELNLLELLRDYQLKKPGCGIPLKELLDYMRDAAKAIDYLNAPRHDVGEGVVAFQHSDVKPENLMLMGGSVLLCDFGVAKTLSDNSDMRATSMGGSLAYISPESLNGKPSNYSDQFSLAISYLELRTGELPFESHSVQQVINERSRGAIDLSKLPPAEAKVVQRAISLRPDARFSTVVEFVDALRAASVPVKRKSIVLPVLLSTVVLGGLIATPFIIQYYNDDDIQPIIDPEINNTNNAKTTEIVEIPEEGKEELAQALKIVNDGATVGSDELKKAVELYTTAIQKGLDAEMPPMKQLNSNQYQSMDRQDLRCAFTKSHGGKYAWISGDEIDHGKKVSLASNLSDKPKEVAIGNLVYHLAWLNDETLVLLARDANSRAVYTVKGEVLMKLPGSYSDMVVVGGKCYVLEAKEQPKASQAAEESGRSENAIYVLKEIDENGNVKQSFEETNNFTFSQSTGTDTAIAYEPRDVTVFDAIVTNKVLQPIPDLSEIDLAILITRKELTPNGEVVTPYLAMTPNSGGQLFYNIFRYEDEKWRDDEVISQDSKSTASSIFSMLGLNDAASGSTDIVAGHADGNISIWGRDNEGTWSQTEHYDYVTDEGSSVVALGAFNGYDGQKYLVCGAFNKKIYLVKRGGTGESESKKWLEIADFSTEKFDLPKSFYADEHNLTVQFQDGKLVTWNLPHCLMAFEAALATGQTPKFVQ